MIEGLEKDQIIEQIGRFDTVEILVNEHKEMLFEGIIDAMYIEMHFERVVNASRDFDMVKLVGYQGKQHRILIAEVLVKK